MRTPIKEYPYALHHGFAAFFGFGSSAFAGLRDLMPVPADSLAPAPQTITKAAQVQMLLDDTTCTLKEYSGTPQQKQSMHFRMIPER